MNIKISSELILASQSPRRKEILRMTGISFKVLKPNGVIENPCPGENPPQLASRLALEKAQAVARLSPYSLVLGADTVVACRGKIFGKPKHRKEAQNIMESLQGCSHFVWTGVALVGKGIIRTHVEKTLVFFKKISPKELNAYLSTKEPYDKAGGYAIQGKAGGWIDKWEGDYFNVMGLPLRWVIAETNILLNRSERF